MKLFTFRNHALIGVAALLFTLVLVWERRPDEITKDSHNLVELDVDSLAVLSEAKLNKYDSTLLEPEPNSATTVEKYPNRTEATKISDLVINDELKITKKQDNNKVEKGIGALKKPLVVKMRDNAIKPDPLVLCHSLKLGLLKVY